MANASSGKLTLSFEVYNGTQHLFRKDLSAESVTIGRGPAAMLRVEDDALAWSRHARRQPEQACDVRAFWPKEPHFHRHAWRKRVAYHGYPRL